MKILVVEDEKNISDYLKKGLIEAGYSVDAVFTGEDAIFYAQENYYDFIILDVMVPVINGYEICKILRKNKINSHIIMLTAKDKVNDKVTGLDAGADDYMTKPFSFAELLARIRALSRRNFEIAENIVKIKDLEVDFNRRVVLVKGEEIVLTSKEFLLLEYFIRNKNQVLTRTMIYEQVWDINFITDTNVIDVYINKLRSKIDKEHKLIQTVRGVGYILKV